MGDKVEQTFSNKNSNEDKSGCGARREKRSPPLNLSPDYMTVAGAITDLVFVLDENGFIFYDNVRKLASENLRFHKFVENFQNNSANSLFYSQTLESLYVGHKDQTYSKFTRIPDSDATRETFGDVVNIEVFL